MRLVLSLCFVSKVSLTSLENNLDWRWSQKEIFQVLVFSRIRILKVSVTNGSGRLSRLFALDAVQVAQSSLHLSRHNNYFDT